LLDRAFGSVMPPDQVTIDDDARAALIELAQQRVREKQSQAQARAEASQETSS
jgi:Arc/MetJ family transcription regulator